MDKGFFFFKYIFAWGLRIKQRPKQNSAPNSANTILKVNVLYLTLTYLPILITRLQNLVRMPLDYKPHVEEIEGQRTATIFIF